MPLNIKNAEVERLVQEVARMTGESKTEAVRQALLERRRRLAFRVGRVDRRAEIERFLEREVWARIPKEQLGTAPDKEELEGILGFGPEGH
jgi:antitoxin VapB